MREIKFRGLSVEPLVKENDWLYGNLYINYDDKLAYIDEQQVHFESVGQYIDLKDGTRSQEILNGIEIFEGDILYDPVMNEFYTVTWDDSYANFFLRNTKEIDPSKSDYDFAEYDVDVCNTLYIIGNIHENPELLTS